jgi:hypothetical protein
MGPRVLGYGIFVRFRRSRLPLRRGIAKLEDAIALAEQFRAERFHAPDAVFVVKEPEGTIVSTLTPVVTAAPLPLGPPPSPPSVPASVPPSVPPELAAGSTSARRWAEQLQTMQQAIARVRQAQARLERAYDALEIEIRIHGATPPDALVHRHQHLDRRSRWRPSSGAR